MPRTVEQLTATIANGASLSNAVNLARAVPFAIVMPAAWDAAGLSFQGSFDGGTTFVNLHDAAGEVTVAAGASRAIVVDPTKFGGARIIKVRSGTAAAAVNQTADRALVVVTGVS